jgi:hypothetical protein
MLGRVIDHQQVAMRMKQWRLQQYKLRKFQNEEDLNVYQNFCVYFNIQVIQFRRFVILAKPWNNTSLSDSIYLYNPCKACQTKRHRNGCRIYG